MQLCSQAFSDVTEFNGCTGICGHDQWLAEHLGCEVRICTSGYKHLNSFRVSFSARIVQWGKSILYRRMPTNAKLGNSVISLD